MIHVKTIGKYRIREGREDLGDIDVLGIIPKARIILAIECKDLLFARSPSEMKNQLEELVVGTRKKKPTIALHKARVQWLERNVAEVLRLFNLETKGNWRVKPMLVSDSELCAPYLEKLAFPFWPMETLNRMTKSELLKGLT